MTYRPSVVDNISEARTITPRKHLILLHLLSCLRRMFLIDSLNGNIIPKIIIILALYFKTI